MFGEPIHTENEEESQKIGTFISNLVISGPPCQWMYEGCPWVSLVIPCCQRVSLGSCHFLMIFSLPWRSVVPISLTNEINFPLGFIIPNAINTKYANQNDKLTIPNSPGYINQNTNPIKKRQSKHHVHHILSYISSQIPNTPQI